MANGRDPTGNSPSSSSSFSDLYTDGTDPATYSRRALGPTHAEEDAVQTVILPPLNFSAMETSIERYQEAVQRGSDNYPQQHDVSKSQNSRVTHENSEGLKRKHGEPYQGRSGNDEILSNAAKRQRPLARSATERLPIEIWQQVFFYLSPAMLCRCLRVCMSFHRFLTQTTANALPSVSNERGSKVCTIDSEAIWTHSRKVFYPRMPRPLTQWSELAMLRLMAGSRCQFCDRVPVASPATTPFNTGPGPDGCRVIWSFGIRSCGKCLESRTLKDVEVLTDRSLAPLRAGVPYVYRTSDLNVVADSVRQLPRDIPHHLRVAKIYYKPDLEAVRDEETQVKLFGEGAVDEWRKGLATKGRDALADASRWERWEHQARTERRSVAAFSIARVLQDHGRESFQGLSEQSSDSTDMVNKPSSVPVNAVHPLPRPVFALPSSASAQLPSAQQLAHIKPHRTPGEVEALRKSRRAEIEHRCAELDPPITANVLRHMEAYQAAMQIAAPLTDLAWALLEPRLLAQRESAESIERMRAQDVAALQISRCLPGRALLPTGSTKDQARDHERKQQSLRARLGQSADEYINGQWHGGRALTWDTTPIFAANALHHVWRSFAHEQETFDLQSGAGDHTQSQHDEDVEGERSLTLDNMKWVYDTKVRPLADQHRREHFLCASCSEAEVTKWFAFESLMQHFGAKHTSSFSRGNIVVHWPTAKWPEEPPFKLRPESRVKSDKREVGSMICTQARYLLSGESGGRSDWAPVQFDPIQYVRQLHRGETDVLDQNHQEIVPKIGAAGLGAASRTTMIDSPALPLDDPASKVKLANDLHTMWSTIKGIETDLECVLVRTVFYHAAKSFHDQYGHNPALNLVTQVLSSHEQLRSLKMTKGLACKVCVAAANPAPGDTSSYYARIRTVKLRKLSSLLEHFAQAHSSAASSNWVAATIETPSAEDIDELRGAPGMDAMKHALIIGALDRPNPPNSSITPRIGGFNLKISSDLMKPSGVLDRLSGRTKAPSKRKKTRPSEPTQSSKKVHDDLASRTLVTDRSEPQESDPSRFDTDFARNKESIMVPEGLPQGQIPLREPEGEIFTRSPSVGCNTRDPPDHGVARAPQFPAANASLDIAAILAALNEKTSLNSSGRTAQHLALAPQNLHDDGRNAHVSRNSQHHASPATHVMPVHHYHDAPAPTSTASPSYLDAVEALRSSLFRGSSDPSMQHAGMALPISLHHRYTPHTVPSSQQPHVDGGHQGRPNATSEEQAVRFIQIPPTAYVTSGGRDHPRPGPITYIDEYGQSVELIPINQAPQQQVQHISHLYGHQARPHDIGRSSHATGATAEQIWMQYQSGYDTTPYMHHGYNHTRG